MYKKSMKTTAGGIAGILGSLAVMLNAFSEGDGDLLIAAIPAFLNSIALLFARDHTVSSREAGVDEAS